MDLVTIGEDPEVVTVHSHPGTTTTRHKEVEAGPIHLKTHHILHRVTEITHRKRTVMVGTKDLQHTCLNRLVTDTTAGRVVIWVHHLHNPPCTLMVQARPWAHLLLKLITITDHPKITGSSHQLLTRRGTDKGMVNPGMTTRGQVNIMEDKLPSLQPTLKIQDTGSRISMVSR